MKKDGMLLTKIRSVIFILFIFTINIIMLVLTVFRLDTGKKLYGSTIDAVKPTISSGAVMSGNFQSMFDDWYLENFPYRYYFVKAYNTFLFELKEENNRIVIGKNGYLYGEDYIDSYTKENENSGRDDIYMDYAQKISYIQTCLERMDKKFIYIISPSKAVIYPEFIPDRYMNLCRDDRMSNLEYEMYSFENSGVDYINGNLDMFELKSKGIHPYYKQGIHWNSAAASLFLKKIDDCFDIIPGTMNVSITRTESNASSYIWGENDLYQLVNGFSQPLVEEYYSVNIQYENTEEEYNDIFILGTSFSDINNELLKGALADGQPKFDELIIYKYLETGYYYHDGISEELVLSHDPSETNILEAIMKSDVVIFENNSTYIPDSYLLIADYLYQNLYETHGRTE